MKFLDGMYAMTDGFYIQRTSDGWCVVGPGMTCPVSSVSEGRKLIKEIKDLNRIKQLSRQNPEGN